MQETKVLIADSSYLVRAGIKGIISEQTGFRIIGTSSNQKELFRLAKTTSPDILTIDPAHTDFGDEIISEFRTICPDTKIIAISKTLDKQQVLKAVEQRVESYLLQVCSKEEITEALHATRRGDRFFCGRVLDIILDKSKKQSSLNPDLDACLPVALSSREIEIIKLIAQTYTNKEIAEKLFLSTHTVNTHRKNIMQKLEIRNTAGLVMFAINQNLVSSSN